MPIRDRRFNWRRFLGTVAIVLGMVAMFLFGILIYYSARPSTSGFPRSDSPYVAWVTTFIAENGATDDLQRVLEMAPKPEGWVATYVTYDTFQLDFDRIQLELDRSSALVGPATVSLHPIAPARSLYDQTIIASYPPGLGREALARTPGSTHVLYPVTGPDDVRYGVGLLIQPVYTLETAAEPLLILTIMLFWLTTAGWLTLDARHRGSDSVFAWFVLAMLTGPLALAVWLISRPKQIAENPVCPGCGSHRVKGTLHCVQCGFALEPACPECRRAVQVSWKYCGHCGCNLDG